MTDSSPIQPERVNVEPVLALKLDAQCGNDPQQIAQAMGQAFGTLGAFAQQHPVQFAGPPPAPLSSPVRRAIDVRTLARCPAR